MRKTILVSLLLLSIPFIGGCDRISGFFGQKGSTKQSPPVPDPTAGQRNGPLKMYYDNGMLKAVRNYKNDLLHGSYKEYYQDGTLKVEGNYSSDKMDGVFKRYHPDGSLKAEEVYKDNLLISRNAYD